MNKLNKTKKIDIIIVTVIILLAAVGVLAVLLPRSPETGGGDLSVGTGESVSYTDYNGKTIASATGGVFDAIISEKLPDSDVVYYNTYADMMMALKSGKVDAAVLDEPVIRYIMNEYSGVTYLEESLDSYEYGFTFAKNESGKALCDQFSEYLRKIKEDKTIEEIDRIWFGNDDSLCTIPDLSGSDCRNGVLRLACDVVNVPFVYMKNGKAVGYEIDIAYRFCREYGYGIEVVSMDFDAIIPAVQTGMCDFGCSCMTITDERRENLYFSESDYTGGAVLAVRTSDVEGRSGGVSFGPQVPRIASLEELDDEKYKIGVSTGAAGMYEAEKLFRNAAILQYDVAVNGFEAVKEGLLDAYVFERRQMELAIKNGLGGVTILDENVGPETKVAVGISRRSQIPGLREKINRFLVDIHDDGTADEMLTRWAVDENYTMPELTAPSDPEFTVVVGTSGTVEPYSFYVEGGLTGYDIEMAKRFAYSLNADVRFEVSDYPGMIAAAESGSIDCIFSNLNVTPERAEVIDYSSPTYVIRNAVMVALKDEGDIGASVPWYESIAASFEKNFIREDRWKMILDGVGITCLITALSAAFGSVLAFLVCMFRRTGSKLAGVISDLYVRLLQGTPIVVLLMILYYVVLGKTGLDSVWVAVIGFTLNFGAYTSEIMRSGIESIDPGQREAALALGYNETQTFFRFIFPQAVRRFMPVYRQEIVSLLKSTSIVGYIAIQDLTKMGDIIRSRTYEAFFPLIATAVIYFILAWIISLIIAAIMGVIDRRHRKKKS